MQEITKIEAIHIVACMVKNGYADEDQANELHQRIADGPAVKFDGYMPDCPGWCGDLFFIVWGWHDRITYASRNDEEGYKIVFDGELPQSEQLSKLVLKDIPLEEQQRADFRNERMDTLAPLCNWAALDSACTAEELAARHEYREILKVSAEWEVERGL